MRWGASDGTVIFPEPPLNIFSMLICQTKLILVTKSFNQVKEKLFWANFTVCKILSSDMRIVKRMRFLD